MICHLARKLKLFWLLFLNLCIWMRFGFVLFLNSHLPFRKKRQRPRFTSFQWIYLKSWQVGLTHFCRTHRTFGIKVTPCNHVISIVAVCRHWLCSLCLAPTPLISELTWFISLALHGPVYIEIQKRGKGWDSQKINSAGKEINPFINAFLPVAECAEFHPFKEHSLKSRYWHCLGREKKETDEVVAQMDRSPAQQFKWFGGLLGGREKSELGGNISKRSFAVVDIRKYSFPFQVSLIIGNFGKPDAPLKAFPK